MKICNICKIGKEGSSFYKERARKDGLHPRCKECHKGYNKEYHNKNPQKWRVYRMKKYGITPDDYDAMRSNQNGLCAICGDNTRKLYVDHSHSKNKVRGLLCNHCNVAIGHLREDVKVLQRAIDYLGGCDNVNQ